jgi:ferredoxin
MPAILNTRKCPVQEQMCKAIPACPKGAITYQADENEPLGGKILIDTELCDNCGLCVEACCGQAINLS